MGGLPKNSVARITDRPCMTFAVDCGRKESDHLVFTHIDFCQTVVNPQNINLGALH